MTTTAAAPPQWPAEVVSLYEPVRRLGKGGFASVMLARKKDDASLAAIKVVGGFSKQNYGYAHREIDILKELSHPNIMRVLNYWEDGGVVVMALTCARGPTLDYLIQTGGALATTFGRVVMAQLMDALAYCHGRAVLHRDIKPDNVIVACVIQDELWVEDAEDAKRDRSTEDWKQLCEKWHVTLVDFGFARAMSPDDIEIEKVAVSRLSTQTTTPDSSFHSRGLDSSRRTLDKSVSHALKRTMSALGNRMYAAPEIVQGVHSHHSTSTRSLGTSGVDITKTLSQHVSNYGMMADAFSLGNALQYMMTGVPPNQNVNEVVRTQRSPIAKFFQWMAQHVCKSGDPTGRQYQYRAWSDLPPEAMRLIRGLNHPSVTQRTSIRATRRYPFIEAVLDDPNENNNDDEAVHHRIHFLQCALKRQKEAAEEEQEERKAPKIGAQKEDRTEPDCTESDRPAQQAETQQPAKQEVQTEPDLDQTETLQPAKQEMETEPDPAQQAETQQPAKQEVETEPDPAQTETLQPAKPEVALDMVCEH